MGDILVQCIIIAAHIVSGLPLPAHTRPTRSVEVREERIHLVTVVFPAEGPSSRPLGVPEGERTTYLVDARTYGAWDEGEKLEPGDLRWLRPDGSLDGRRAVVAAKEVRRRCYRMRGQVERVAVPVAECDWYRWAPSEAGYALETASYGEVEHFVAHRKAPCDARAGKPLTRTYAEFRVADAPMSGDLRRWSGGAEVAGRLIVETTPEVVMDAGRTWDAARAAASWPYDGPLSEFVGALTVTWSEQDDVYATCVGKDGTTHVFLDPR